METPDQNSIQNQDLGGTTNLSLDQLKKEGGIAYSTNADPDNMNDPDDLHEIQAGDDLNEPDADAYEPDEAGGDPVTANSDNAPTADEEATTNINHL